MATDLNDEGSMRLVLVVALMLLIGVYDLCSSLSHTIGATIIRSNINNSRLSHSLYNKDHKMQCSRALLYSFNGSLTPYERLQCRQSAMYGMPWLAQEKQWEASQSYVARLRHEFCCTLPQHCKVPHAQWKQLSAAAAAAAAAATPTTTIAVQKYANSTRNEHYCSLEPMCPTLFSSQSTLQVIAETQGGGLGNQLMKLIVQRFAALTLPHRVLFGNFIEPDDTLYSFSINAMLRPHWMPPLSRPNEHSAAAVLAAKQARLQCVAANVTLIELQTMSALVYHEIVRTPSVPSADFWTLVYRLMGVRWMPGNANTKSQVKPEAQANAFRKVTRQVCQNGANTVASDIKGDYCGIGSTKQLTLIRKMCPLLDTATLPKGQQQYRFPGLLGCVFAYEFAANEELRSILNKANSFQARISKIRFIL